MQDVIANALNCIMNAKRAKKEICIVPSSKLLLGVLGIMKKKGYISSFKEDGRQVEIAITNLNSCKAIKPRSFVKKGEFDKYVRRFLPARDFGMLIVTTSKGLMTHEEAIEKNIGGSLVAFCY